ncbi:hypothetical protein TNCV_4835531 [Trichonephila clavipes]|nr:hypothetical protein TNCV_4835531 [Trichonephila clavipes]
MRTDPKHCACASATRESVGDYLSTREVKILCAPSVSVVWRFGVRDYLSTRAVEFVCSASERSVEIGIQRLPLNERGQVFVLHRRT